MKDYTNYYPSLDEYTTTNGKAFLKMQLAGSDGVTGKIDDVEQVFLFQTSANEYNDRYERRVIVCELDIEIRRGSHVIVQNKKGKDEDWIVVTDVDVNEISQYCVCQKANTTIKYYNSSNTLLETPCITSKFGRGNDGTLDLTNMILGANKTSILAPNNSETIKFSQKQGNRFIIGNTVYKTIQVEIAEFPGLVYCILEQDEEIVGVDDMVNRIAQNIYSDTPITVPETGTELIIDTTTLYYGYALPVKALLYIEGVLATTQPVSITYTFDNPSFVDVEIVNATDINVTGISFDDGDGYPNKTRVLNISADDGINTVTKTVSIERL